MTILVAIPAAVHAANPQISVSPGEISISGATPQGEVLILGMTETRGRSATRYGSYSVPLLASSSGAAAWRPPTPIEGDATWIAIDVETGKYTTVSPGARHKEKPLPEARIKKDNSGQARKVEPRLDYAEMIVVRPTRGSWQIAAGDGGVADRDGALDGKIDIDLRDLTPAGRVNGRIDKLEGGDLVFVIHPDTRSIFTRKVTGQ